MTTEPRPLGRREPSQSRSVLSDECVDGLAVLDREAGGVDAELVGRRDIPPLQRDRVLLLPGNAADKVSGSRWNFLAELIVPTSDSEGHCDELESNLWVERRLARDRGFWWFADTRQT